MSGTETTQPSSLLSARRPMPKDYELHAAIRTDPDTAKLLQTTLEAVGTALFDPDRVDWSVWLHLTMIAALADAAMHKKEPERFAGLRRYA